MRIITEKRKYEIGKHLAVIYLTALFGFGHDAERDMESASRVLDSVIAIGRLIGGDRMVDVDIPSFAYHLQEKERRESNEK